MHRKRVEHCTWDITPRIVPADRETTVEIRPLFDHGRFDDGVEYEVRYYPADSRAVKSGWPPPAPGRARPQGGVLRLTQFFEGEQEHVFYVSRPGPKGFTPVGDFRVYSLVPDLFARRPFRGDLHMHSCRSDGRETPAYVAGSCRRIGLDFMAVTDHRLYAPSLEARAAYAGVPIDLEIFPGEEIHPPDCPVHIVSFGARSGMTELFADDAAYRRAVDTVIRATGAMPPGVVPHEYGAAAWVFDKIREAGGLGIFCHPYWFSDHQYALPCPLTDWIFERQPFDALELVGGYSHDFDSDTLQIARYNDERARGRRLPIVGTTDSHGVERRDMDLFDRYSTVVFAPSLTAANVIASVKDLYSVAILNAPEDRPRAFGPFRLVKYALFLLREVFPGHDELAAEEGRLMLGHAAGDATAKDLLARLTGRTAAYMDGLWAGV
jgi:hypothetical protein